MKVLKLFIGALALFSASTSAIGSEVTTEVQDGNLNGSNDLAVQEATAVPIFYPVVFFKEFAITILDKLLNIPDEDLTNVHQFLEGLKDLSPSQRKKAITDVILKLVPEDLLESLERLKNLGPRERLGVIINVILRFAQKFAPKDFLDSIERLTDNVPQEELVPVIKHYLEGFVPEKQLGFFIGLAGSVVDDGFSLETLKHILLKLEKPLEKLINFLASIETVEEFHCGVKLLKDNLTAEKVEELLKDSDRLWYLKDSLVKACSVDQQRLQQTASSSWSSSLRDTMRAEMKSAYRAL